MSVPKYNIEDLIEREQAAGIKLGPFHRERILQKAPDSVRRHLRDAKMKPLIQNTRQGFMGMDVQDFPPASFTACTSTTGTLLWGSTVTGLTTYSAIPLGDPRAGKAYKVSYGGIFSTSSSAPTAIWTPAHGSSPTLATGPNVVLGASTGTTMIASLANVPFYGEFTLGFRAIGLAASTSTGTGNGFNAMGGLTTAAGIVQAMGATVATTLDTTTLCGLGVWLTYGTAQASNTATCQWVAIQSLN